MTLGEFEVGSHALQKSSENLTVFRDEKIVKREKNVSYITALVKLKHAALTRKSLRLTAWTH